MLLSTYEKKQIVIKIKKLIGKRLTLKKDFLETRMDSSEDSP